MTDFLRPVKSRRASPKPPLIVKVGSAQVPICATRGNGRDRYFVSFYCNGVRVRRSFSYLDEAKTEARNVAQKIMRGQAFANDLSPSEREELLAAQALLEPNGTPLLTAVREYAECAKLLNGGSVLAAIKDYQKRTADVRIGVTVPEAAAEFLAAKKQDGGSKRYLVQLKSDITRFAAAFTGQILHIKSHEIDAWLRGIGKSARTRNSTLTSIRTFFSWAKSVSYLPKNQETEAEAVPKVRVGDTEAEIFTPAEMQKLLAAATAELIPFLALGGFAGFRTAEIGRLDWTAVDFDRRINTIRAGQAQTASRRIVPMSENLAAWLLPQRQQSGLIVSSAEPYRGATALAKELKEHWPQNVLWHSFISYRLAQVKNVQQVVLEAGNSPAIIFKH
jgi:integrase